MYRYTDFDRQFLRWRAAQFRDQLTRWQRGDLTDEQFLPLRLQNGWYVQRYAPMLRVALPYGQVIGAQLCVIAHNVQARRDPALAVVTLPLKHARGGAGRAPGDADAGLLDALADLADTFGVIFHEPKRRFAIWNALMQEPKMQHRKCGKAQQKPGGANRSRCHPSRS